MEWEEAQLRAAEILTRNEGSIVAAFTELGIWPFEDVAIPVGESAMRALLNPPTSISIEGTRQAFEMFAVRIAGLCAAFAMTAVLADRERVIDASPWLTLLDALPVTDARCDEVIVARASLEKLLGQIRGQPADDAAD